MVTALSGEVVEMLTADEARQATDAAKEHAQLLWLELYELRQRQAHIALGYATTADYWQEEFNLSERTARQYIVAAKVKLAIESHSSSEDSGATAPVEGPVTERVARVFTPLIDRDEDAIPKAWQAVVEEHDRADVPDAPITAPEAKRILIARGFIPDTTAGGAGKPGWFELLGRVGDSLLAARKHLDRAEREIIEGTNRRGRAPSAKLKGKAEEYIGWADELSQRLASLMNEAGARS